MENKAKATKNIGEGKNPNSRQTKSMYRLCTMLSSVHISYTQ